MKAMIFLTSGSRPSTTASTCAPQASRAARFSAADHDALVARSHGWRALYDPAVGFLRGKKADGTFPAATFDPKAFTGEYAEANAWQSLWMAGAHDTDGLVQVLGGRDPMVAKLEKRYLGLTAA